jgi:hypothetical protein
MRDSRFRLRLTLLQIVVLGCVPAASARAAVTGTEGTQFALTAAGGSR